MGEVPTIETERLVLRGFVEDDLDEFAAVMTAPQVKDWLRLPDDYGREHAWREMALWLGQWALRGSGNWAVVERATARLVGRAGTHRPERADWPGLEIGWTLHPDVWGRGYAKEAGAASVEWAFANHDVDELVSVILPTNLASQAVARSLGFRLREARVFAHLPDEPLGVWVLARSSRLVATCSDR